MADRSPGLRELHARELVGIPGWESWSWRSFDGPPGGCMVEGGVTPLVTVGKRKGQRNYRKADKATVRKVFLSDDEHTRWALAWSERTGGCITCAGNGEIFTSWDHIEGTKYAPCRACNGTGKKAPDGNV